MIESIKDIGFFKLGLFFENSGWGCGLFYGNFEAENHLSIYSTLNLNVEFFVRINETVGSFKPLNKTIKATYVIKVIISLGEALLAVKKEICKVTRQWTLL